MDLIGLFGYEYTAHADAGETVSVSARPMCASGGLPSVTLSCGRLIRANGFVSAKWAHRQLWLALALSALPCLLRSLMPVRPQDIRIKRPIHFSAAAALQAHPSQPIPFHPLTSSSSVPRWLHLPRSAHRPLSAHVALTVWALTAVAVSGGRAHPRVEHPDARVRQG